MKNEKAKSLLLDTRNLNIKGVTSENGDELKYEMVERMMKCSDRLFDSPRECQEGDIFGKCPTSQVQGVQFVVSTRADWRKEASVHVYAISSDSCSKYDSLSGYSGRR